MRKLATSIPLYLKSKISMYVPTFLSDCTGQFVSSLVRNPEDRVSSDADHYKLHHEVKLSLDF